MTTVEVRRVEDNPKIGIQDAVKQGMIIHCKTIKEAKRILTMAHKLGYKCHTGESYKSYHGWDVYESKTHYDINMGMFSSGNIEKITSSTIIESTQIKDMTIIKSQILEDIIEKEGKEVTPAELLRLKEFVITYAPAAELVEELRRRGYEVAAEKTTVIKL